MTYIIISSIEIVAVFLCSYLAFINQDKKKELKIKHIEYLEKQSNIKYE